MNPSHKKPLITRLPAIATLGVVGTVLVAPTALAANHPERKWLVRQTAHFSLHYYPGLDKTAERFLRAAEEAYPKLAADFGVKMSTTEKIPIIITHDSLFNGEAEPVKDRITLDPVLANSSVVGTQRFLAHELAHVMTFRAVNKGNKMAQLSSLGGMPTWFLEGIAQYTSEYWYPSTDRMLRLHTLENTLLTHTERANFRMLGAYAGAAGYNEGFALCRYMFGTYGRDKLPVLMASLKEGKRSFEQAVEATFGQNMAAIEAAWKQSLRETYAKQIQGLQEQVPGSTKLVDTYQGEVNVLPKLSPDGKQLAYLTSRYQDSFLYLRGNVMGFLSLYVSDADGKNPRMVPIGKGAVHTYDWSGDGKKLVYSRLVGDKAGNPTFDLFVYDTVTKANTRLTTGEGTNNMAWRPTKNQVAFVSVEDGQNTVKLIDVASKTIKVVLQGDRDVQFRQPAWSPDGTKLVAVTHKPGQQGHLVVIDPDTGNASELTKPQDRVADAYPTYGPDGKSVFFTSDRGGMTNLYTVNTATKAVQKLTNTYRGAEMPSLTPDGKAVYFTSYRSKGSMIYRMPIGQGTPVSAASPAVSATPAKAPKPQGLTLNQSVSAVADTRLTHVATSLKVTSPIATESEKGAEKVTAASPVAMPDQVLPGLEKAVQDLPAELDLPEAVPYKPTMTNDMMVPQMTSDERGQQLGLAGVYSDILNKHMMAFDVRYGLMSQRFSYMFQYMNRMWDSTWMATLYDSPQLGISPDVGTNGQPILNSLYFQRQRGVMLGVNTPLGSGRSLTTMANLGTLSTLMAPRSGDFGQLRTGQHNTVSVGYQEQHISPTVDMDINPSDGYRLGGQILFSDAALGSNFNYTQYLLAGERYFSINPDWRHNLTWRFNLGMQNGDAAMPFMLGGATGTNPVFSLRGYAVGAFTGNRIATTGLEYTAPIFTHIDKMVGPLYLDRLYVSGFVDAGSAWYQGASANPFASTGAELRLRTSVMGRQLLTFRIGLAQKLGSAEAPGFYLAF
ncbi:translocation protein TolB [compost metagenome]